MNKKIIMWWFAVFVVVVVVVVLIVWHTKLNDDEINDAIFLVCVCVRCLVTTFIVIYK